MKIRRFVVICFLLFGNCYFETNAISPVAVTTSTSSCDNNGHNLNRTDCGWSGMHREQCECMGCCFNSSDANMPNCYIRSRGIRTLQRNCDFSKPTERRDCGWPGITKLQCEAQNCCYDGRVIGVNHCFHSYQVAVTTSTSSSTQFLLRHQLLVPRKTTLRS